MSVDLTFIYLNDIFHSLKTIVESQGLGESSMLVGEEKGICGLHDIWDPRIVGTLLFDSVSDVIVENLETLGDN